MNHQDTDQAIKSAFGESPDDVLSPARQAGEVLDWLHAILFAIERTTDEYIVRSLANAGATLQTTRGIPSVRRWKAWKTV
jgi:hypothetical protein